MGDVTTMTTARGVTGAHAAGMSEPETAPETAPHAEGRPTPPPRRRPELAAFLRGRRARVTPADVGMAPGLRRRTPGLRREEVAQLSGVGVTWYTWLERYTPWDTCRVAFA